jgi:hypothetical protein
MGLLSGLGSSIVGAGASIFGDLMSQSGQQDTNAMQMQIMQQQNAFNAQQAQINRDWETDLSNTQMQRRVTDLRAAGLNPLLAIGQGGASSPMMGPASAAQSANVQNPSGSFGQLGQQATSALQLGQQAAQVSLLNAQARSTNADADAKLLPPDAPASTAAGYLLKAQADSYATAAGLNQDQAIKVKAETANVIAQLPRIQAEVTSAQVGAQFAEPMAELARSFASIGNILAAAKEPEAQAQAHFFSRLGAMGSSGSQGMMKLGLQALVTLFGTRGNYSGVGR